MSTSKQVPIQAFLRRIEKDKDFFTYFHYDAEQAMQLAIQRAEGLLEDAINRIIIECSPTVDFTDINPNTGEFNFDWTAREKILVPSLMFEYYLEKDIALLKIKEVNYTDTYLKVFDPSNARTSFMDMYKDVKSRNEILLDIYKNTDRITGEYKTVDFDLYDAEDA